MVTIERWSELNWRTASGPMRPCEARAVLASEDDSLWRAVDSTTHAVVNIWAPAKVA